MKFRYRDIFSIILFFIAFLLLIFSGSLAVVSSLALLFVVLLLITGETSTLLPTFAFSIVSGVIIFFINSYFASFDSVTYADRISSAILASLRIFALITISTAYLKLVDGDATYEICSKIIPRSAILTALSLLLLPRIYSSFWQTWESLVQRGVISNGRPRLGELRKFSIVVKTVLVNAVEESWSITESLVHRGYTVRRR